MIIDLILDRKEGTPYDPEEFYMEVFDYECVFELGAIISDVMLFGNEQEVKQSICDYIDMMEYNPKIKWYVKSVDWL